jgi:hypothetical protein
VAKLTITIPDAKAALVVSSLCRAWGYQEETEDGVVNPETETAFVKRMLREYIVGFVRQDLRRKYDAVALQQAKDEASALGVTVT